MSPRPRSLSHVNRAAAAVAVAVLATVGLSACAAGAIGQNTPASSGDSFVSGNAGTTVFALGSGPVAPRVAGQTLTGGKLSLSQFAGHVVVVNFWGSWCTPCREEAPALAALADHFASAGVRFLGVDIRDEPTSALAFARNFRIGYPSLSDPSDEIALAFRNTVPPAGIPTTLVISRTGRITARVIGAASFGGLDRLITRAAQAS
ncbi:MAG TPA: TlpA disulfide reductase family protein [Streptosporangiaceae bacterium]|nr:TlpA disulfide reductase family protein [Streptosporangiaceae bacterium]